MTVFNGGAMVMMSGNRKLKPLPITMVLVLLLYMATASVTYAQHRERKRDWHGVYAEIIARSEAHKTVMPEYPGEAVRRGLAGVVEAKIGIDKYGRVGKIKIQPGVDPLLTKAVVKAVKQWTFMPRPAEDGSDRYMISRLTFNFLINYGEGQVEMYTDAPGERPIGEGINGAISAKELTEWGKWEQVWERPADPRKEK
jgi:TonB family protein